MLDHFIYGQVSRISPEAPIPVLKVESQQSMLGGLGNVVRNLGALGCSIQVFSITGDDSPGQEIHSLLNAVPNCQAHLLREPERQTPVKVRYVAHGQQLLRADNETAHPISAASLQATLRAFEATISDCSVVILSDYAKGTLAGSYASEFIQIARAHNKPVIVDPKGRDFTRYRNATLIKPNAKELAEASQLPVANTDQQISAARKLLADTGAEYILLTRGADGMLLIPHDGEAHAFKSLAREVFEVSGAGDTVASALAAALGSGCSIDDSAAIANIAAGIVVGKVGTATVDRSEIEHEIEHKSALIASDKILRPDQAVERIRMWKRSRLKVGFISGVFSNLAPSDLERLEKARNACDRLVIAVRKDPSANQDQPTRAYVLASMVFSDAIVVSDDPTTDALLTSLQPDLVFPS